MGVGKPWVYRLNLEVPVSVSVHVMFSDCDNQIQCGMLQYINLITKAGPIISSITNSNLPSQDFLVPPR